MKHYVLSPRNPGMLLSPYETDSAGNPTNVGFQYLFWSSEPLFESRLYFMRTSVTRALLDGALTGWEAQPVQTQKAPDYNPESELGEPAPGEPEPVSWLRITGAAGKADFGLQHGRVVVSERALALLREHGMRLCFVDPYDSDTPPPSLPKSTEERRRYFEELDLRYAALVAQVEAEGGTAHGGRT